MSFKTSTSYTEVEDYDCSVCDWSLHVEKDTWTKFADIHDQILAYINEQIDKHIEEMHAADAHRREFRDLHAGVQKAEPMYPVDKNINIYKTTPYLSDIDMNNSSLKFIE